MSGHCPPSRYVHTCKNCTTTLPAGRPAQTQYECGKHILHHNPAATWLAKWQRISVERNTSAMRKSSRHGAQHTCCRQRHVAGHDAYVQPPAPPHTWCKTTNGSASAYTKRADVHTAGLHQLMGGVPGQCCTFVVFIACTTHTLQHEHILCHTRIHMTRCTRMNIQ